MRCSNQIVSRGGSGLNRVRLGLTFSQVLHGQRPLHYIQLVTGWRRRYVLELDGNRTKDRLMRQASRAMDHASLDPMGYSKSKVGASAVRREMIDLRS